MSLELADFAPTDSNQLSFQFVLHAIFRILRIQSMQSNSVHLIDCNKLLLRIQATETFV